MAEDAGCPEAKLDEADRLAAIMDEWPVKQVPGRNETRTGTPPAIA